MCISAEQNFLVIREPVMKDGTPCDNGDSSNAVCIQGTCTVRLHAYIMCIVIVSYIVCC